MEDSEGPVSEPTGDVEVSSEPCERAGCPNAAEPGTCPYAEEINDEIHECNCCAMHRQECADDI